MPEETIGPQFDPNYYSAANQRFSWPAIRPVIIDNMVYVWGAYGTSDLHKVIPLDQFPDWLVEHRTNLKEKIERARNFTKPAKPVADIPVDFSLDNFEL